MTIQNCWRRQWKIYILCMNTCIILAEIEVSFKNSNRNGRKYIAVETKYSFSVQQEKYTSKEKKSVT